MASNGTRQRSGFTLVELLAVVAIIGTLVGLLLPAVQAAREASRLSVCANNVKQIALGTLAHHDARQMFPGGYTHTSDGTEGFGWLTQILPYVEQTDLAAKMPLSVVIWSYGPGTSAQKTAAAAAAATRIPGYLCPSSGTPPVFSLSGFTLGTTNYGGVGTYNSTQQTSTWNGKTVYDMYKCWTFLSNWGPPVSTTRPAFQIGIFRTALLPNATGIRLRQVLDGTSKTLLVGEVFSADDPTWQDSGVSRTPWWSIGWLADTSFGINAPAAGSFGACTVRSRHAGGCTMGMADGAVRFFDTNISQATLLQLTGMQDGQTSQVP